MQELNKLAAESGMKDKELALSMAVYMLGFSSYYGFDK